MNVYKLSDIAEEKYRGAGLALALVSNNEVVKFTYIDDILTDYDADDHDDIVTNQKVGAEAQRLAGGGSVSFGMLSGREFTEL